jgi:hypothetical protein
MSIDTYRAQSPEGLRILVRDIREVLPTGLGETIARQLLIFAARLEAPSNADATYIDWLEMMANQRGGILLHDGSEGGRLGLGLRPGSMKRTLREAIATAMSSVSRHG